MVELYGEYDGPHVRYDLSLCWVSLVPAIGMLNVIAAGLFLAGQSGREVTSTPAHARGSIVLGAVSHAIYAMIAAVWFSGVLPL